jgi:hypothetical protein
MRFSLAFVAAALIPSAVIGQQGFSCSYGDRGACLGFGETVCSNGGMCVDSNASCFDSYQCNYEGFTCKSNVTECTNTYNRLLDEHNELVRKHNTLLEDHRDLLATHNDLVDDHNSNLVVIRQLKAGLDDVETCLIYASSLEAAQLCSP